MRRDADARRLADGQGLRLASAQCTPGESVCADNRTATVCSTNGAFVEQGCTEQCARGRCVDPIRESGLIGCDRTKEVVCDSDFQQCCQLNGILTPGSCEPFSVACQTRFVQCDGPSDCPDPQVCCYQINPAVESITCKTVTDCVDTPPNTVPIRGQRRRIVCDPSNPECPAGSQCLQTEFPFVDIALYHCTPAGEVP